MIKVQTAEIELTEIELQQIIAAVAKAKKENPELVDEPIPDCDMSMEDYYRHQRQRGIYHISDYSGRFTVVVDTSGNRESRNFHLKK